MSDKTNQPVTTKTSGVQVSDLEPKKDAKGGLLPAVAPQAGVELNQKLSSPQAQQFHK
jgi:hypothetical protein